MRWDGFDPAGGHGYRHADRWPNGNAPADHAADGHD
jgi:hypothetical protein